MSIKLNSICEVLRMMPGHSKHYINVSHMRVLDSPKPLHAWGLASTVIARPSGHHPYMPKANSQTQLGGKAYPDPSMYEVLSFHIQRLRANISECCCQEAPHTHMHTCMYMHPQVKSLWDCHQEDLTLRSMKSRDRCQGDEGLSANQMTER